jgi:ribA/ribD-fused uncharacterized protein
MSAQANLACARSSGARTSFSANQALGGYLKATGSRVLVEASPVDLIWGIGLAAGSPAVEDIDAWPGLNLLGFALMEARSLL